MKKEIHKAQVGTSTRSQVIIDKEGFQELVPMFFNVADALWDALGDVADGEPWGIVSDTVQVWHNEGYFVFRAIKPLPGPTYRYGPYLVEFMVHTNYLDVATLLTTMVKDYAMGLIKTSIEDTEETIKDWTKE